MNLTLTPIQHNGITYLVDFNSEGTPDQVLHAPDTSLFVGKTGKFSAEAIKAGGNAIVPQVAHQIFKAIEQFLTNHHPITVKQKKKRRK